MTAVDPVRESETVEGPLARIVLTVPADLDYFDGHFPAAPIVPGVVQVKWAIDNARRCFALSSAVTALEAVKFQRVIGPCARVALRLEHAAQSRKVHFSFDSEQGRHSSGRIVFSPSDAPHG
jgi:3-hydroxymyristoyl/3-hydroxydecanoyl-(acyl carrier protein) dehydratase